MAQRDHLTEPVDKGYHGTTAEIGHAVLPSSRAGVPSKFSSLSDANKTYFAVDEETAWHFAPDRRFNPNGGRPRVYVTRPVGEQQQDPLVAEGRTAPFQAITDTLWAPPPGWGDHAVEQTLPHINWNQFGGENWRRHNADKGYPVTDSPDVNNRIIDDRLNKRAEQSDERVKKIRKHLPIKGQKSLFDG